MIRLLQQQDLEEAANIAAFAYPGMNIQTSEKKTEFVGRLKKELEEQNGIQYFGYFNEKEQLLGMYRQHDFECNINGTFQRIFGIGMVAVHLLHKKEKIAFELLSHFHDFARQQNVSLVSLYPFNPSFYRKMGYGYGPMKYEFKIKPNALIANGEKGLVKFLSPQDEEAIVSLYNDYAQKNHGMIKRTWTERQRIKNGVTNYVGVIENEQLVGALAFTLESVQDSHFLHQHMIVHEWIWTKPDAYKQLASWLHSQQDQVDRIIFRTNDQSFVHALTNPLNDSNHLIPSVYHEVATTGTGLMYRITNIIDFIHEMNFQPLRKPDEYTRIVLEIEDTFLPKQNGLYEVIYNDNLWSATKLSNSTEKENIKIGIPDISSWWMGCVSIEALYNYGTVSINNVDTKILDDWFKPNRSPICFTSY
ncbi:GNAT family N-acetyltransferase [Psychrobacillus soli]|uniref:GNAT family N-acetyltransferase n=1 Tax=Psychrobacillus soli TaxID=1543965 RepID=A0A544SVT5_9BACI|nr:GNAT family N-acetyltransferase [Psychrobacillus soli]TQR09310.1 GNAT family N-acetyltransferase [Psychrobacillus soli]